MAKASPQVAALEAGDPAAACDPVCEGVWAFDLFSPEFVEDLLAEIDYFYSSKLPAARPNSMNNYGVIVNDVGLEPFIACLQRRVLTPLAAALFGDEGRGDPATGFDSTHAFVVKYREDEDPHLDVHTDDSDVTFNVCLGRVFEGCGLVFCGMIGLAPRGNRTVPDLMPRRGETRIFRGAGSRRRRNVDIPRTVLVFTQAPRTTAATSTRSSTRSAGASCTSGRDGTARTTSRRASG